MFKTRNYKLIEFAPILGVGGDDSDAGDAATADEDDDEEVEDENTKDILDRQKVLHKHKKLQKG